MDINYKLKKLRVTKKQILDNKDNIKKQQMQDVATAVAKIEREYNISLDSNNVDLNNIIEEIHSQCKIIEQYSTFNIKDISNILASLISIYESESFLVENLSYKVKGALFNDALLIINKKKYEHLSSKFVIQEKDINILVKNGFAIKLLKDFSKSQFPTKISFYKADSMGRINQKVNFRSFTYIRDFMEYVINYRIENNLDEISFDELEMLRNEFINFNIEEIQKHHICLDEIKRKEFEASLEHDKQVRNRKLQKILKSEI